MYTLHTFTNLKNEKARSCCAAVWANVLCLDVRVEDFQGLTMGSNGGQTELLQGYTNHGLPSIDFDPDDK